MGKGSGSGGRGAVLDDLPSAIGGKQSRPSLKRYHSIKVSPKGLQNVGNTCYANAALQCLLSTALSHALLEPEVMAIFRGYASNSCLLENGSGSVDSEDGTGSDGSKQQEKLSRKEQRRKKREEKRLHEKSDWLTRMLTQITREYAAPVELEPPSSFWFTNYSNQSSTNCVDPGTITRNPERLCKCLRPYQQEDAHEFMRALLSTLTMNGHNKQLSSLFDGLLESAVTCQRCERTSLTRDRYMDLSVDICKKGVTSLEDALHEFTKTELLDVDNKVNCVSCGTKQPVAKALRLATAPSILVCHLKRFAYNERGRMVRLSKHISFPQKLEIGPYMSRVNKATPPPYELVGVLVHEGQSCDSGHYLSYVKCQNEWYKANDSVVTKIDIETVLQQQAYILVYEVSGMRSSSRLSSLQTSKSWKCDDIPPPPEFRGSTAPTASTLPSAILNMLCNVSEANDDIVRDFCCGAGAGMRKPTDATRERAATPIRYDLSGAETAEGSMRMRRRYRDAASECDSTLGESSTVYTTDSSQVSGMRRSTSGGNLRQLEVTATQAYSNDRPRTYSFTTEAEGKTAKQIRSQSARKPRVGYTAPKPPSQATSPRVPLPPRPGHRRAKSTTRMAV